MRQSTMHVQLLSLTATEEDGSFIPRVGLIIGHTADPGMSDEYILSMEDAENLSRELMEAADNARTETLKMDNELGRGSNGAS